MSPSADAVLEAALAAWEATPAPLSPTRPLYWSVRRELWENRSIHLAPLAVAAFAVVALVVHGLALAAVFLAAAVRLRRYREPI